MFTLEYNIFLTESYFKNAERQENCEWKWILYKLRVGDFPNTFPQLFREILENAFENMKWPVNSWIEVGREHFEHLLQLLIKLHYSLVLHLL
jgi:hypothetical protein